MRRLGAVASILAFGLTIGAAGTLAGCHHVVKTPAEAYQKFSSAVTAGDGGALFDALDQPTRWAWMTIQKYHRESYDIVLSNYPEGAERERESHRFQGAATATSARALFRAEVAPGLLPMLLPLVAADAKVEGDAASPDGHAAAVLASGARVPFSRGEDGGWGFSGLAKDAEDLKMRAFHDLEVVRASAADYERAATRPENDPEGEPSQSGRDRRARRRRPALVRVAPHRAPGRRRAAHGGDGPADEGIAARIARDAAARAARGARARAAESLARLRAAARRAPHAREPLHGRSRRWEVSGLKRSGGGHLYFCLKDAQGQLDCVLYGREAARLKFQVQEGMAVRCRGRLTLYEARGRFQMTVAEVEPTGAGALALAFEQLKTKLAAEGLFDTARKRALPFLPRRVGVVTSATGAVIRDIVRVAHRRCPVPILLAPTPVQGEGASLAIAAALRRLAAVADVDVIIVARGGGSLEDLWPSTRSPWRARSSPAASP